MYNTYICANNDTFIRNEAAPVCSPTLTCFKHWHDMRAVRESRFCLPGQRRVGKKGSLLFDQKDQKGPERGSCQAHRPKEAIERNSPSLIGGRYSTERSSRRCPSAAGRRRWSAWAVATAGTGGPKVSAAGEERARSECFRRDRWYVRGCCWAARTWKTGITELPNRQFDEKSFPLRERQTSSNVQ